MNEKLYLKGKSLKHPNIIEQQYKFNNTDEKYDFKT